MFASREHQVSAIIVTLFFLLRMYAWKTAYIPSRQKGKLKKCRHWFCFVLHSKSSKVSFPLINLKILGGPKEYRPSFYGLRKLILKSIKKNKHTRIVEKILKIKNQERELLYELSKHGTKTFCVNAMILVNELVGECNKME